MRISQALERLRQAKLEHGDIEVSVFCDEEMGKGYLSPVPAHIVFFEERDKTTSLVFTNEETADQ